MNGVAPREMAAALARQAGRDTPIGVAPLEGGRNNRVFRVDFADAPTAVLKWYHSDPRDPRDRLKAEWEFLAHVSELGIRVVPRPLAASREYRAALYSFVPGTRVAAVTEPLNAQAADFVIAINRAPDAELSLEPASEVCFSIADHIEAVQRRIDRLKMVDGPGAEEVRTFVEGRLTPVWEAVRGGVEVAAAAACMPLETPVGTTVVSPSDFGFHNALVDADGHATFIDFEYAGVDDPAKLICDYFCQHERPVPTACRPAFVAALAAGLRLDDLDLWRARILLPVYRVKWVCIMRNEYSGLGARRRGFAEYGADQRCNMEQLRKAQAYLDDVQL